MILRSGMEFKNQNILPSEVLEREVKGVCVDLNKLKKGDIFLVLKDDDHAVFKINAALKGGAQLVLAASDYGIENCYAIANPRKAWALLEKKLHHDACDKLKIVGVTGTNGKTTTTHILYNILKDAGKKVALIGTLGAFYDSKQIDTGFTTPDPDILHELFERFVNDGVEYVVMEVSAHALALEKMAGVKFDVGVLTNITQDHLDFFGDMDNYEQAKYKLFSFHQSRSAVVCADTINMRKFSSLVDLPTTSYGLHTPCDVFGNIEKASLDGSIYLCNCNDKVFLASTPLVGEYNVENCLAATAAASRLGIDVRSIQRAIKYLPEVEGRFNVKKGAGKQVVIDYAHTPDGLEKIIKNVKPLAAGKVITVFGCGGNRDASKRPVMGKIASSLSDVVVLTSDNPRLEEPMEIISQIADGIVKGSDVKIEPDRARAIKLAINSAEKDDVVIIAGKGGEKYQDIGGVKIPYDDLSVVEETFFEINEAEHLKGEPKSVIKR